MKIENTNINLGILIVNNDEKYINNNKKVVYFQIIQIIYIVDVKILKMLLVS